jgi:hypothetical protein
MAKAILAMVGNVPRAWFFVSRWVKWFFVMQSDEMLKIALADVLTHCLDRSMRTPLMVCMMSRNGSVIVVRCIPDCEEPAVLAEHSEDDRFVSPIGALVLDQTGQALKFVLDHGRVAPESATGHPQA